MAMQTRTDSAYTSPAEPRTIPGDMFHRKDIFREELRMHALGTPTMPMPQMIGLFA